MNIIYLSQTNWSIDDKQTTILLFLKIFQYDLKCNTFTHGKLPHGPKGKKTNHISTH